ncbi:hypothetical protein G4B88_016068 [Cannabis sativa]|uniref:C2H2-type domain-containing protein n=1 Tax=Cannabis sativa TaxID=3483 RepID=A0A7J6ER91_CANSA|nr:hypothetical protein G4B88_016068 [Cannabis sativa]
MPIITGCEDHGGRSSFSSGNFGRESGAGVEKEEVLENLNNNNNNNNDPSAEVIALSPNTLLARNRFVCEICNKGFQRDQNLQLHRRGHNLPWKLRQRSPNEVIRKRVYICPETSCVHHNPTRALGDLTGIKKHFCRKHGEKKWKCEKCSKKYAVQSDWKAHSKTCGTREYKCECGTIFSRRDSFITHRAFCDAIAEENNKTTTNTLQRQNINMSSSNQPELMSSIISSTINEENELKYAIPQPETTSPSDHHHHNHQFKHMIMMNMKTPLILDHHQSLNNDNNNNNMAAGTFFSARPTTLNNNMIPPPPIPTTTTASTINTNISSSAPLSFDHNDHHFGGGGGGEFYLSATALLQKAAQMGATTVSSASSAMAPSIYATTNLDHDQLFIDNNNNSNNNKNNVGLFSGLLCGVGGGGGGADSISSSTFLKEMELSMKNDNTKNAVLHGGGNNNINNNTSSSSLTNTTTTTGGGDVMTVDFLGIGSRSASSRQGNFIHHSMQTTLTQLQQHAALMEKHAWEFNWSLSVLDFKIFKKSLKRKVRMALLSRCFYTCKTACFHHICVTQSSGDRKDSFEQETASRRERSPAVQFAPLEMTFRRRLLLGVGSASLVAVGANFLGVTSFLLGLSPETSRNLKLDVVYPIGGYNRCIDTNEGFVTNVTEFIYPATWVGDQRLLYRAAERKELERSLDPPSLNTSRRLSNVNEPVVAFGPPGTTGELNVSVIVSPVSLDFKIEAFGGPNEVGETIVRTITGSGKRPEVKGTLVKSNLREDSVRNIAYYELEFRVESPSFRRHNVAVCCVRNGRLFTLNAQAPESAWPEVKLDFQRIAQSFSLTS